MSKQKSVLDKTTDAITEAGQEIGQQVGMVAMATAAVVSMIGHDEAKKVVVPSQPIFAMADENLNSDSNPIRREKESEESGPHYVSYRVAQRTPARSGNH